MPKQNQTVEKHQEKPNQQANSPEIAGEQVADSMNGVGLLGAVMGAGGDDSVQAQAARLMDRRFLTAQRQAMAMQIGRVGGNKHLQRVMTRIESHNSGPQVAETSPERPVTTPQAQAPVPSPEAPMIQRAGLEGGAGVESGSAGTKVELNLKLQKEIPMKYAKAKLAPKGAISATLKPKKTQAVNAAVTKSTSGEGAKASYTIYKDQAVAAGSEKFGELAYKALGDSGWELDQVDLEEAYTTGEKTSLSASVKFTFKNGFSTSVKATMFEQSAASSEFPSFSVEPTLKVGEVTLWENEEAKLDISGSVGLEMKIEPNWTQLIAELSTRAGARALIMQLGRSVITGLTSFLLSSAGLATGAALVAGSLVMSVIENAEIEECKELAREAVQAYVHGWCVSWGIKGVEGGMQALSFYAMGVGDGNAKLEQAIMKIQNKPDFAPFNFTADEIRPVLLEALAKHEETVYNKVRSNVQDWIYRDFVLNYYQREKDSAIIPAYTARLNAQKVAAGLGLKDWNTMIPEE
jgi:hypothetical protein